MSFVAGFGKANCDIFYLNVNRLPNEGEEVFSEGFCIRAGGGVPATMAVLSRLSVPTRLQTYLGKDPFSALIEAELRDSGVEFNNLYTGNGIPVIISTTIITKGDRTFVSYSENIPEDEMVDSVVENLFFNAKIVEMQLGKLDIYRKARQKDKDKIFVLDTGWLDDLSIEKYKDYLEFADYYTPNRKEALKITGAKTPEQALRVLSKYFKNPIVKLDSKGCLVMKNDDILLIPSLPDITAVDSTGAGDAFLAGFMYGLYHDHDIVDCVLFGNITGGVCVQEVGCLTAKIGEPELLRLANEQRRRPDFAKAIQEDE